MLRQGQAGSLPSLRLVTPALVSTCPYHHSTVIVMGADRIGGLCGICAASPNKS